MTNRTVAFMAEKALVKAERLFDLECQKSGDDGCWEQYPTEAPDVMYRYFNSKGSALAVMHREAFRRYLMGMKVSAAEATALWFSHCAKAPWEVLADGLVGRR